jgi:hypothetical protein
MDTRLILRSRTKTKTQTPLQDEGDFMQVPGRVFEDADPQPGDVDYDGNWRTPTPNMHFDEQDENVPPHGLPSPGYHGYDSDSDENGDFQQ